MKIIEELKNDLALAKAQVAAAQYRLDYYMDQAENNVFPDMETAKGELEDVLGAMALKDCEGSFNCGSPEYHRHFMLEGSNVVYVAVLDVEYNRHDKQYYYVEDSEFRVEVTDK